MHECMHAARFSSSVGAWLYSLSVGPGGPLTTVSFGLPHKCDWTQSGCTDPGFWAAMEEEYDHIVKYFTSNEYPSHITSKNEKRNFRLAYFCAFWFPAGELEENVWKTINLSRDSCTIGKGRDHVRLGLKRAKKIHGSCVLRQLKRRKGYFKVVMKKLLVSH